MQKESKILLIGQAPPAQRQEVPYDTTMLYDWLAEVGVDKNQAQNLLQFDAVYDKFPGYKDGGHDTPKEEEMEKYWEKSLKNKVIQADKIWVMGKVAMEFLTGKKEMKGKKMIYTIHPSKRNIGMYKWKKKEILDMIDTLINY